MVGDRNSPEVEAAGKEYKALFSISRDREPGVSGYIAIDQDCAEEAVLSYDDLPGPSWIYEVHAERSDGRTFIKRLTISSKDPEKAEPITSSRLRSAPIGVLLERVRSAMSVRMEKRVSYLKGQVRTHLPKEGRSHPDEHYMQVAWVDAHAEITGRPPREAIAEHWQVSSATASRWRRAARRLGYLPGHDPRKGRREAVDKSESEAMRQATKKVEEYIFVKILQERVLPACESERKTRDIWAEQVVNLIISATSFKERLTEEDVFRIFLQVLERMAEDAQGDGGAAATTLLSVLRSHI